MLVIGSVIDEKYKILNQIGHGGMSNVYLAIHEKTNKTYAIKEVNKQDSKQDDIIRQSLVMETDLLKKIKHPNLPNMIDVIEEKENFLLVMDYVEGDTLQKLLEEERQLAQEKVVAIAIQLCEVLDYLHHRTPPVIYRDLKPSNIMLKPDGTVVLIDFGTAREYKENRIEDTICLGTKGYAAPEQFGGMGQTDARTDIFCLGVTIYHLITGHNPATPPYERYPLPYWNPSLSVGLEAIIDKCTRPNPEQRFQSVKEVRMALDHYKELDEWGMLPTKTKRYLYQGITFFTFVYILYSLFCKSKNQQTQAYQVVI